MIWESFIEWLEKILVQFGLPKLLGGLATLLGAAAALGFLVRPEVASFIAGLGIVGFLLLTCVALLVDRRRLRKEVNDRAEVLDRYGQEIFRRQNASSFDVKEWRDEQYIGKNGDTKIFRWFTLVVGDQPMQTFWHRIEMTTQRTDDRYKRKLKITAHTFDPETKKPEVELLTTDKWVGHSVRLFVHLNRIYAPGKELRVLITAEWPEFTKELVFNNRVDAAVWIFNRKVNRLHVIMSFDKCLGIKNFGLEPLSSSDEPKQTHEGDGTHKVEFVREEVPTGTEVGFNIQRAT